MFKLIKKLNIKENRYYYYYGLSFVVIASLTLLIFKPFHPPGYYGGGMESKRRAVELFQGGKIVESISELEKVINRDSSDITSRSLLGLAYMLLGDENKAERHFNVILEDQPENVETNYRLGVLYRGQNKHTDAKKLLEKASRMQSNNLMIKEELIKCYIESKDYPRAENALNTLLNSKNVSTDKKFYFLEQLGDVYLEQKKQKLAITVYSKALALQRNDRIQQKLIDLKDKY